MSSFLNFVQKSMDVSAYERKVIANNVANYNTPGYKATEVKFENFFSDDLMNVKATNDKHIQLSNESNAVYQERNTKEREDGNNVDVNKEMTEMIKNNYRFNNAVTAFNKEVGMMRTALGR